MECFIVQLIELLGNWEDDTKVLATQSEKHHISKLIEDLLIYAEDPSVFLAIKIHAANANDLDQFIGSTQFDIEELETYTRAMQGLNATKWAKAIKEKLDQLHKNNTWILLPKSEIEPGY